MLFQRRSFLAGAGAGAAGLLTTTTLTRPALAQTIDPAQISPGTLRELNSVLGDSSKLNPGVPQVAAAGPKSVLDVAEAIDNALQKGTGNQDAQTLAARAGLLLSQLTRDNRDGVDFDPAAPQPAAARDITPAMKTGYKTLFAGAKIQPSAMPELTRAAKFILSPSAQARYKDVSAATGVPWYVIGALHYREANLNFMGHLHNGDPLLMQTVDVPANRPPRPWLPPGVTDPVELWKRSAIDALGELVAKMAKYPSSLPTKWTLQGMCFAFESFNGFGCRDHGINSPYLWNYTNQYTSGGFPRDHVFSPSYRSKQAGLVAIMVRLQQLDSADVHIDVEP